MTIAQAKRFYEEDLKKYDLSNNKELLNWIKEAIKNGYHPFVDVEDLQQLIDNIVCWYEIKYTERQMEFYSGVINFDFENMKNLSKFMDINQLMYRLPHNQLCLMECNYRSNGGGIRDIYNANGDIVGQKEVLLMKIDRKDVDCNVFSIRGKLPSFLLRADTDSGKVDIDHDLKDYVDVDDINLEELLVLLKAKYNNKFNYTKLEECLYDHNCDVELRKMILQLVALKLLYSNKTIPERGYERAKRFIKEFNKELGLNLSTEEIDLEISKDYTNNKNVSNGLKRKSKSLDKVKSLIKSL